MNLRRLLLKNTPCVMFLILFDDKSLWNETFLVTTDSLQRVIDDIQFSIFTF